MKLEDFLNKRVFIELKDGEDIDGILVYIEDKNEDENEYTSLNIRVDTNEYRLIYLTEIATISEIG